jgi:Cu(I)/Ag(I) efflux system membrane protein CusA/SilA
MPIAARLVMLQSGMRAPFGVELRGPSLAALETAGLRMEKVLKEVPELRPETVFADRLVGKPYLEIEIDRGEIARCGLTVADVQAVIQTGIGGAVVTRTVEGRERYAVRVRYGRRDRDSVEALKRVLVATRTGDTVPLEQFATFRYVKGPQMIRSEDTFLTTYVLFDKEAGVSELGAVEAARGALERARAGGDLQLPAGVTYAFAGTWENQVRSEARLRLLVPLALLLVFVLLYLQFRRASTTLIVASGVMVAAAGGFILLWLWGQPALATLLGEDLSSILDLRVVNLSVAVWVGFIALAGIATDDGVLMSTYLEDSFRRRRPETREAIDRAVLEAGRRRIRPCLMTTATTLVALLPVLTATGRGADVMRPVALPIFGGMLVELVTLFVVPVLTALRARLSLRMTPSKGETP